MTNKEDDQVNKVQRVAPKVYIVLRSVYYVVDQFQSPLAVARGKIVEIYT